MPLQYIGQLIHIFSIRYCALRGVYLWMQFGADFIHLTHQAKALIPVSVLFLWSNNTVKFRDSE